jgi:hypothetical protein
LPYAVACSCGHTLFGQRRRRHQVVPCPKCGKSVFVLPTNVYPSVPVDDSSPVQATTAAAAVPRRSRLRAWRLPLVAALATLLVAVIFFLWVWPHLGRRHDPGRDGVSPARAELDRLVEEGRRELAAGNFALAREKFKAAMSAGRNNPEVIGSAKGDNLNDLYQLRWQSELLANELRLSLIELLREAAEFGTEEGWQAQFNLLYRGKWVVIDDEVYRDARGRTALLRAAEVTWRKEGSRVERHARVVVDDLALLRKLPLAPRQRWLFGARLASFSREGDEWVIRFDPESGVLLTDADAVKAWKPALSADPLLADLLERQAKSARQLRVPEP